MNWALDHFMTLQFGYPHLASFFLCLVKSGLIVTLAAGAAGLLGRRSAAAKNWAWRCAVIGLLGLAFWEFGPAALTRFRPVWRVQTISAETAAPEPGGMQEAYQPVPDSAGLLITPAKPVTAGVTWLSPLNTLEDNLKAIWFCGIGLFALWRAIRWIAGYWWLRNSSQPASDTVRELAHGTFRQAGVKTPPDLAVCTGLTTPLLVGWTRPSIVLPEESSGWDSRKLEAVLLHELAHWQRMDCWWQSLTAAVGCIWWWNPLVWLAGSRLRMAAEQAADDLVVLKQQGAESYARALVEIAAAAAGQNLPMGIAMAGRSSLETRLRAILKENPWRGKLGKLGVAVAVMLTCVFLGLGASYIGIQQTLAQSGNSTADTADQFLTIRSEAGGSARGHVVGPDGSPVVGAKVQSYSYVKGDTTLYAGGLVATTDSSGDFSFPFRPGYEATGVEVMAPGFAWQDFRYIPFDNQLHDLNLNYGVTVTGRLIKDGKPVPNIEIGITQTDLTAETYLGEITGTTDQAGRFTLKDVAPNDEWEVHAKRDSLGMLGVARRKVLRTQGIRSTVSAGDISIEPGLKLGGVIVMSDGNPSPRGANPIQLHVTRPDSSDEQFINLGPDHKFEIMVRDKETVTLYAWISGYHIANRPGSHEVTVHVHPDMDPIHMVFDPGPAAAAAAAVSWKYYDAGGTVMDDSGHPISGANVTVVQIFRDFLGYEDIAADVYQRRVVSDDQGHFSIPKIGQIVVANGVPRNARFTLLATAPGYCLDFAEGIDPVAGPVRFKLQRLKPGELGGSALLHIVDPQGKPVPGAQVSYYVFYSGVTTYEAAWQGFNPWLPRGSETDGNGNLTLPFVPAREAAGVEITAPGYARAKIPFLPFNNRPREVVLNPGVTVTGRVVKDGKSLPNIQVGIAQTNLDRDTFVGEMTGTTDQDGQFAVKGVPANTNCEVYARRDSLGMLGVPAKIMVRTGGPGSTTSAGDILIDPGLKIGGWIVLSDGNAPLATRLLTVHRPDTSDVQWITLGPDLKFDLMARNNETVILSPFIPGYDLPLSSRGSGMKVQITKGMNPIDIGMVPNQFHLSPALADPAGDSTFARFESLDGPDYERGAASAAP